MPKYDFVERHETLVRAPAEATWRAVDEWQIESSSPIRILFLLRGLGRPRRKAIRLRDAIEENGFLLLADNDREVVYGQIGRFWALNERAALVSPATADEFLVFDDPRYAVAVMDIRVEPVANGTRLTTETRVRCLGRRSRRLFRIYWFFIRPFSGLLRRRALHGIKGQAERNANES